MLKANTDIREGSEQAAAWGICQSPRDGADGTQLELYPLGQAGKGPLHACPCCIAPAQQHLPPVCDQSAAVQVPQESNSSSNSVHVPSPQQSSEADPSCTSHPPQAAPEPHYLFKCSSRKRKVMRLGSGSERRRCIMQFSLAAGSERAAGKEGEGSGQGVGQQQDPPQPDASQQHCVSTGKQHHEP